MTKQGVRDLNHRSPMVRPVAAEAAATLADEAPISGDSVERAPSEP